MKRSATARETRRFAPRAVQITFAAMFGALSIQAAQADDSDFFSHNFAAVGIVGGGAVGTSSMAPVIDPQTEIRQTEVRPRPAPPRPAPAGTVEATPPGYPGRFANRSSGVQPRVVPKDYGKEVRTDF